MDGEGEVEDKEDKESESQNACKVGCSLACLRKGKSQNKGKEVAASFNLMGQSKAAICVRLLPYLNPLSLIG